MNLEFFWGGNMKKFLTSVFLVCAIMLFATSEGSCECDKAEAKELINTIVQSGLAERQESGITVWYIWKANWYGMPREQRYNLISGLGGVEQCLAPGRATRIRVAGKDVARVSPSGNVELLD